MDKHELLIWKRLERVGDVSSSVLKNILNITNVHASRLLKLFLDSNSSSVYKDGKYIKLLPKQKLPDSLNEYSLLDEINMYKNIPEISGVLENEFPLVKTSFSNNKRLDDILITILKAIKNKKAINAIYISLSLKKSPDHKEIPKTYFPFAFRVFDGMLYLLATEIAKDKDREKIKMYSLSRFQYVEISSAKVKLIPKYKKIRFTLVFNSAFTNEQKDILIEELELRCANNLNYYIDLYDYEEFNFKQKYININPSYNSTSIHPIFVSHTQNYIEEK